MKNSIKYKHIIYLLILILSAALLSGCMVYNPYAQSQPQVSVNDIVQMSKDGVPAKDIVSDIRNSHSYYTLNAGQLAKLQNEGVSDTVINYMEKTHFDAIRYNQGYYSYPGYYWGSGWGGYYYPFGGYWGGYWGPSIIFSERIYRGGGGGFHSGGFHGGGGHSGSRR